MTMFMLKAIFFLCGVALFYIYAGYPVLVSVLGIIRDKRVAKSAIEPAVSILIAAYNEENIIGSTLKNKLELDYPKDKLEIIVISDCSTDGTDGIVNGFAASGIKLIRQEPRAGKTAGLNKAAGTASGEILVFTDANSIFAVDALRKLVANFKDRTVGYVTGKMVYASSGEGERGYGCGAYMRYENFLRVHETRAGSVVGVNGGIDAVRKNLFDPMKPDQLPDLVLPLKVVEKGFRVVYEPDALLEEESLKSSSDEYRMRVRVSLRALWALYDMKQLLGFGKDMIYAWQLWSHKVFRYGAFLFLIGLYTTNVALRSAGPLYKVSFVIQNAMYLGAIASALLTQIDINHKYLYLCKYFFLLNLASAHAFFKFLLGRKQVVWSPRKG
jgi:cellulose synthase/poly-beta-1,6-N-acetylglucosamine synthase-like glycosyltransferase